MLRKIRNIKHIFHFTCNFSVAKPRVDMDEEESSLVSGVSSDAAQTSHQPGSLAAPHVRRFDFICKSSLFIFAYINARDIKYKIKE